ncbi:hypothetical protein DFQ27_000510 [Actinomortierella ambigua]|uniref:Uncharacterized protein n=1 Tax=Actinomortierella ambigua TaxID=1343610 RepID=A0A9P6QGV4_9FUNG|nr:hypothetical protein DFQ27_000510 [Actinomortierella ambigua]
MTNTDTGSSQMVEVNMDELRKGIVDDLKQVLEDFAEKQDKKAKDAAAKAYQSSSSGLGFMEGVIIGGILVAFMLRFSR